MPVKTPTRVQTAVLVGIVVLTILAGVFLFGRRAATAFSCSQGGQSAVLQNSVITFSCTNPRFIVSCDERTVSFYAGAFWCASFDGRTTYRFSGAFQQVK